MHNIPISITNKETTLIIGAGEVGISLGKILMSAYKVDFLDQIKESKTQDHYNVINICFPDSIDFVDNVKEYQKKFTPDLTIIHSTVSPGTTQRLAKTAFSPISGRHPHLEEGIKTFAKVVAANDGYAAYHAVEFLNKAGIKTKVFSSPMAAEISKIMCTTYYGWNIVFMKEMVHICEKLHVPFHEVYAEWNTIYNQGYAALGEIRFMRPILFPIDGQIGGHCVIPNCDLFDNFLTKTVKERNKLYARDQNNKQRNKVLQPSSK